jgi:hypothetical protein
LALSASLGSPPWVFAQKKTELKIGKLVSLEKGTGKNLVLKMKNSADDADVEFTVAPKVSLVITATGDAGFLRPKSMVQAKVVAVGENLFSKEFTVFLGPNLPGPRVTPDPKAKDLFEVVGQVQSGDAEAITVSFGPPWGMKKIALESGAKINVNSSDPQLAQPGATVEVEGISLRGGKSFNPQKISITIETPLKAEEVFAAEEKEDKAGPKPKTAKTAPKGKGGEAVKSNDPFGVLDKKKPANGKEETKPVPGNDPFGVLDKKKPEAGKDEKKKDGETKPAGTEKGDKEKSGDQPAKEEKP